MNRGRITTYVLRVLFFLALVLFLSLSYPLTAQGDEGEPPFPDPVPPSLPMLELAAAPVTIGEFPAPTTPVTVTITNHGTGPAQDVTLYLDGGLLTLPVTQTVGLIELGQTITTTLALELQGYELGEHSLLLTSDAISLTNPVQTTAVLTLVEPTGNSAAFGQPEKSEGQAGDEKGTEDLPAFHLLQVQRPPTNGYRGRILTFNLENSKGYEKELELNLATWLPGVELVSGSLQLSYASAEIAKDGVTEPALIDFHYEGTAMILIFTPAGDGQYVLSTTGAGPGESLGSEAPEDPKGWEPTFNAPTVSLFRGSADYQYPMLTPPGPGLFQPTLALGYSGSAGNGYASTSQNDIAGFGWNLTGSIEVSQGVTLCSWNIHRVCPANAYWYDPDPGDTDPGYAMPGLIELTLSLGGTGYDLTHVLGESQNGYAGRYMVKGNSGLYVEYCRYSVNSDVCLSADTGDGNVDGAANATQTKGYWVIKDSQNTLYRLGYTTDAEQELVNWISDGGYMGPWAGSNAAGHALRWRVDKVKDRFSNQTNYTYNEYLPSQVNPIWSDAQVHTRSSNLTTITYGFNQIVFNYSGRGDSLGIPPNNWNLYPDVITWQTHLLSSIDVNAKDYETGSGNYNLVRSYQFNYLIERHGNNNDPGVGISNQSSWCLAQNTSYWGWKLALLTSITELDSGGLARVRVNSVNKPDVEFVYWWYKTALFDTAGTINDARYCAPYLLKLHTPYNATAPVATFTYNEAPVVYHNANGPSETTTWLNRIASQTLNGGWTTDAPVQVTQFSYSNPHYGGKASSNQWQEFTGAFQGFQDVTSTMMNGGSSHLLSVNHFLAYNFNSTSAPLTGNTDWQDMRTPGGSVLSRSEESWTMQNVPIPLTSNPTLYTDVPVRTQSIQYSTYYSLGSSHNVGNRTTYTYDDYGNPSLVKEYGAILSGGTPYRVQQTEYAHNTNPTNWLIGLPWQTTVWDGEPNGTNIVSRQRTRYDGASCTNPGSQVPTNGLATAIDIYIPGGGSGHCDLNFVTTIMNYGQNGDLWWQPAQTAVPSGTGTFPNVHYSIQTIHWRNHSTIERIITTSSTVSLGETVYGFNDTHTPWLFTDKTAPNGAMSRYEYDSFGRLIKQYTPDPDSGQATILSQEIVYSDNAPWQNPAAPLTIDVITVPGQPYSATSRTFYDALGRVRQQRNWNLSSDQWGPNLVNKVVTDTEYNALGQVVCQTAPIYTGWETFNGSLDCTGYDHTTTSYTRLGSPAISTGIDGLSSSGLALGRTNLAVDPMGRLSVSALDAFGRLSAVAESEVTEDSFASGTFSGSNWWLSPSYTLITSLGTESVLRVGKSGSGGSTNAATVTPTLAEGSGFFFRFQLSGNNHDSLIMAKATDGSGAYLSLELKNGKIYPGYNSSAGSGTVTAIQIDQVSNAWYRAHIAINDEGKPTWRVWREDSIGEPDKQFTYTLTNQSIINVLLTKTWQFTLAPGTSGGGTAYLYLGGFQQGHYYITRYSYDTANNLTTVTDALGNQTMLTYDLLGRKTTMSDPDMGEWTYAYDLAGNLIRQTDGKKQRLCFTYDYLNRLLTKKDDGIYSGTGTDNCTGGGTTLATYTYHSSGQGLGQVAGISGANNGVSFSDSFFYDYRGRVTTTSRTIAGIAYSLSTGYDRLDRPTTLTYPGGEVVTTGYDKQVANSLTANSGSTTLVSDVVYNHRLEMTNMSLGNNLTQSYVYFTAWQNYRLDKALLKVNGGSNIYYREYEYDAVGNITQFITSVAGQAQEEQSFKYDSLGRLKTAKAEGGPAPYDHTGGNDYEYDAIGNLVSFAGGNTYNYTEWPSGCEPTYLAPAQALPHAVKKIGNNYYCYDKNGNMTRRVQASLGGGVTYDHTFDVENRLKTVTVSNSNLTTNFAYDASGQRVVTDVKPTSAPVPGDTRTITTYPFPGYEVEQRSTWQSTIKGYAWIVNATITRKTYFLGGQAIATHISGDPSSGNNGFFYLHSDHLGSTSLLTYGNGQTNPGTKVNGSETRYYPYGAQRLAPTLPADNITDRDFTGQKENSYIKLIYMNARWYDSQIGRFVSADSIVPQASNPQAYNRYSYVYNNPINFNDPSGHCGGTYDTQTGLASEDQECWDFLYNEFCTGGSVAVCTDWQERLNSYCYIETCTLIYFDSYYWTKTELTTLRDALVDAINALDNGGYDSNVILGGITFTKLNSDGRPYTFSASNINLTNGRVTEQDIWHEMAHAISFRNGHTPQDEYYQFAEGFADTPWYEYNDFCFREYCHEEYGVAERGIWGIFLRPYAGQHPEAWADGFSAWVYMKTYSHAPDGQNGFDNWIKDSYTPNWDAISGAVEWSLIVTFDN